MDFVGLCRSQVGTLQGEVRRKTLKFIVARLVSSILLRLRSKNYVFLFYYAFSERADSICASIRKTLPRPRSGITEPLLQGEKPDGNRWRNRDFASPGITAWKGRDRQAQKICAVGNGTCWVMIALSGKLWVIRCCASLWLASQVMNYCRERRPRRPVITVR